MKKILFFTHKKSFWNTRIEFRKNQYLKIINDNRFLLCDIEDTFNEKKITRDMDAICVTYQCLLIGAKTIGLTNQVMTDKLYNNNMLYKSINLFKKKFIILHDLHDHTYGNHNILVKNINKNFTNVISIYDNFEWAKLKKLFNPNIKCNLLSHYIDTNIYKNNNSEKIYDVTFYGVCDPIYYPFRFRIRNILKNYKGKTFLKINIIPPPDWNSIKNKFSGSNLAKILNQTKIAIATKSKYDYLVMKYFEISSCGTLLAGNMATQGKSIWQDNYLNLDEKMNDEQIIKLLEETVIKYDNDDPSIKQKINKMYNLIQNEYNLEKYYDNLHKIITEN